MRIWTLHPKYLDSQGLVALWREALLARAVLRGHTRGYRHHPQLERFRAFATPRTGIQAYLTTVFLEADARGYSFDRTKVRRVRARSKIPVTAGQVAYEWQHLLDKLRTRSPSVYRKWSGIQLPDVHPLFRITAGAIEPWERTRDHS